MCNKIMTVLVLTLGIMLSYAIYNNITVETETIQVEDYKVG